MQQADFYGEQIHADATAGLGAKRRQLRLALAMRGGVSLAVWIGGGVASSVFWFGCLPFLTNTTAVPI